jgi:hypothetical protein
MANKTQTKANKRNQAAEDAKRDEMEIARAEMMGEVTETETPEIGAPDEIGETTLAGIADDIPDDDGETETTPMAPVTSETPQKKRRGVPPGTKRDANMRTIPKLLEAAQNELAVLNDPEALEQRRKALVERIEHFEKMIARHEEEKRAGGEKLVNRLSDQTADTALAHLLNKRREALLAKGIPADMVETMLEALQAG